MEAEALCRKAAAMDPARHNAHKNLGVALQGQGFLAEAAREYLAAARLCPEDGRALGLFNRLAAGHPECAAGAPGLPAAQ